MHFVEMFLLPQNKLIYCWLIKIHFFYKVMHLSDPIKLFGDPIKLFGLVLQV